MIPDKGWKNRTLAEIEHGGGLDSLAFAALSILGQPTEAAIGDIVAHLGAAAQADRCWMFEYDSEHTRFRNTHEWCARGVSSHVEDLQDTPVAMIAWLHRQLLAGKAVMIDDVARLPAAARALRREMLRQNDKSVLSVPILYEGQLRACIGYDAVRERRVWTDEDATLLDLCGRLIGQSRYGGYPDPEATQGRQSQEPLVYLSVGGGRIRGVPLRAIVAVRSDRNEARVWLDDGSVVIDRRPLHAWRSLLPAATFLTIHRTAIVHLVHIAGLDKHGGAGFHWELRLRAVEDRWPVSRQYRKELVERLGW